MDSILPTRLVANEHYVLTAEPGRLILRVTRSSVPFRSADDVNTSCEPVQLALDAAGRGKKCLLIDSREAPARNDPEYEEWFRPHRIRMVLGFKRVAILMRSVVGRLQSERLLRNVDKTDGLVRIFTDETFALSYLRERERES